MPGAPGAAAARGAGTARAAGAGRGSTPRGRRPDDPANWIEDPAKKAKREQAQAAMRKGPPPGMPPAANPDEPDEPDEPGKPKRSFDRGRFSSSASSVKRPTSIEPGDFAGFLLGLFLYGLAVSYISYGAAGPKTWLRAKFLNEPGTLAGPTSGFAHGIPATQAPAGHHDPDLTP